MLSSSDAAILTIHSPGLTKATPYPSLETFSASDLSALISIRYVHQSEEEANSVCIAQA